ncbi:MAG: DUF4347 domain-containing protein, partial [Pseudomonadota bacterium]
MSDKKAGVPHPINVATGASKTDAEEAHLQDTDGLGGIVSGTDESGLLALEPRILLDAAGAETGADVVDMAHEAKVDAVVDEAFSNGAAAPWQNQEASPALFSDAASEPALTQIAFVDVGVEGHETIIEAFGPDTEIVLIDASTDGVEQMAATLDGRTDIDAVHIVSHGRSGTLDLGSTKLTEASMNGKHADHMVIIASALSENADILLYGCDFGAHARGASAVQALSDLTGADIAASEDLTGNTTWGGDWDLEVEVGTIEAAALVATEFEGTLAKTVINSSGGNLADGSDGLAIHVIANGQLQVEFKGATQTYHPSVLDDSATLFNGVYLAVGNTVTGGFADSSLSGGFYNGPANGPGISSTDVTFVEEGQSVSGTGTGTDPIVVTTTMFYDAGGASGAYNPATDFQVEIITTYVVPNPYFTQSVTITPPASNSDPVKFYHALDTFLNINVPPGDNPDEGPAFTLAQSPGNLSVVGVARDADGDGSIDSFTAFAEVQGGEEFDQHYSAQYDGAGLYSNGINNGGDIVNTIDTDPSTDNGLGIQFNLDQPNVAQTFEYHVAFRGEATIDLDGDDSSGAVGSGFNTSYFVGSGATIPIVDSDVAIQNVVGDIQEVRITLINPLAGDGLSVNIGALPANVGVQSQSPSEIVLETTGGFALPEAAFDLALQQLGFSTTSTDLASRTVDVAITNEIGEEGLASAGTIALVLPPNELPTSAGSTVNGAEDTPYAFSVSDFNFADVDPGDALASVRIDSLPSDGTLLLGGAPVSANDVIVAASLPNLTFVPALNASGISYASFTYSVNDGTAFA